MRALLLIILTLLMAGCERTPPVVDVKAVVERLHRNLAKINKINASYKETTEGPFALKAYSVDYEADVEWLETVKYGPAQRSAIGGFTGSVMSMTICSTPTVVKWGERGPGLWALSFPEAFWNQAPGKIYQAGERDRISGQLYYEKVSEGWKWSCGFVTRGGKIIK